MIRNYWNYIFFSTWSIHNKASEIIIIPLTFIYSQFDTLRDSWNKQGYKAWRKIIKNKDLGFNVLFAYGLMLFSTSVLYSMLVLYVCHFFQIGIGENNVWYFFASIMASSVLTNEALLWWKDAYLNYFKEFEKTKRTSKVYLPGILFHFGIAIFAIITIHLTIGFQF